MTLPKRATLTIAVAITGGLVVLGLAIRVLVSQPLPDNKQLVIAAVLGALMLLSWLRPLIIYRGEHSEGIHFDEGLLVFLLLATDARLIVVTFAAVTMLAQAGIRRNFVKSAFNSGQILIAVGLAVAAFRVFGHEGAVFSWVDVGAAFLAAAVLFLVNNIAVAAILWALGMSWSAALVDGLGIRLLLIAGSAGVAAGGAFLLTAHAAALPLALLPLLILRYTLEGFFNARHDRTRLEGLFQATLRANASAGQAQEDVAGELLASARRLLRCADAELADRCEGSSDMRAPVSLNGETLWLTVTGRSRTEPFDRADQSLLEALAAVGSGALSNAAIYRESQRRKQRIAAITSSLGEGVCALSRSGRITFVNRAAAAMLGWGITEGLDDERLLTDPEAGMAAPGFLSALASEAIATGETIASYDNRFWRADGGAVDVACTVAPIIEDREPVGAVLVFRDISEEKQLTAELTRQALHDALTGLPNRRRFLTDLSEALEGSEHDGRRHAVLFADIDRFKILNDSLGHHAGDLLLISIADRMRSILRPGDVLARFGGDEFTVLLVGVSSIEDATDIAQQIQDIMREPILLSEGHEVVASLSIGIAMTSQGASRDDVLHDADVAMYEAKVGGRSGAFCIFDVEAMGVRSAERIELEVGLRQAIERDELVVHYQPIISILDRRIAGVEALVRWNHPSRGLLPPNEFVGLAEETGLILPIGKIVLTKACEMVRQWHERHGMSGVVAVNLSARQFQHAGLLAEIEDILAATGANPDQVCFEITESLAIYDVDKTSEVLLGLKALGASVAIDDFGTGHSALSYLARFPIDVVKIDGSFVENVEVDPVKSAIVSAVLAMASAIGSITVVEGVETRTQLGHLIGLGCRLAQGFYLAEPMSAAGVEELIRSGGTSALPLDQFGWRRAGRVSVRGHQ